MCANFCNFKSIKLLSSLDFAQFMYIKVKLLSTHWSDDKTDAHIETDQINMKSSLKREIQRSLFSIFDIKDDTLTSATSQESCKVSQRIIDAAIHKKNWLQSILTWEMSTQYHYDDVQVQQRLNVD